MGWWAMKYQGLQIFFFNFLFLFYFFLFVVNFVIHWNETAMGLHVFPIPIPPSYFTVIKFQNYFNNHSEFYNCNNTCLACSVEGLHLIIFSFFGHKRFNTQPQQLDFSFL